MEPVFRYLIRFFAVLVPINIVGVAILGWLGYTERHKTVAVVFLLVLVINFLLIRSSFIQGPVREMLAHNKKGGPKSNQK